MYWTFLLLLLIGCTHQSAVSIGEYNPHGMTFAYQKVAEETAPNDPKELYRLEVSSTPSGKDFFLLGKTFSEKEKLLYTLTSDEEGRLVAKTEKGALPLSDILFRLGEFRKGEPYEYILVSKEGDIRISAMIVPFPIEAVAGDKAKISLVIASPDAYEYTCFGEGFQPGESLTLCIRSGGEEAIHRFEADKMGRARQPIHASVPGKKGGIATLSLLRRNETLNLDFGWGREAMQIFRGEKQSFPQNQ